MKLDVVYTWVDGSNINYIDSWNSYAKVKKDRNPERYRDTFSLLKYSMRSLERYFPFVRKVYLVTARPQIPHWLLSSHPDLEIIHHDQIISSEYLPTFNSNVIESYLHNIPGISQHFLYLNDDHLFGAPTSIERFYEAPIYKVYNTLFGENLSWRLYDGYHDIIGLGLIEHNPIFINKQFWEEAFELYPDKTHKTRSSKFRNRTDFSPLKLYRYHLLRNYPELCAAVPVCELLRYHTFVKITNDLNKQRRICTRLNRKMPEFYCLNDDMRTQSNQKIVQIWRDFLEKTYPYKSKFER